MTSARCHACRQPLSAAWGASARCSSLHCPAGGSFTRCPTCQQLSLPAGGPSKGCWNERCPTAPSRAACPRCELRTSTSVGPLSICTWLLCPSNDQGRFTCEVCRDRTRVGSAETGLCASCRCPAAWRRVVACPSCSRVSFDMLESGCLIPACALAGAGARACPACRRSSLKANGDGSFACRGQGCSYRSPRPGDAVAELGAVLDAYPALAAGPNVVASSLGSAPPPRALGSPATERIDPFGGLAVSRPAEPAPPATAGATARLDPFHGLATSAAETPPSRQAPAPPPPAPPSNVAEPQPPAEPSRGEPAAGGATLEEALDFLLEAFQHDSSKPAPFILVIGLPGAGKTTYLGMLGEILLHRGDRYYFPFRDVDIHRFELDPALDGIRRRAGPEGVRWSARSLAPRVRDLVLDFARRVYGCHIARGHWAQATPRGDSHFLVAELRRAAGLLARIITLEAPGEEYRDMLRAFGNRVAAPPKPILRCFRRLLDLTEGLIVLIDPTFEANDDLYQLLFLALREDLEPRARNALRRLVRARLESPKAEAMPADWLVLVREYEQRLAEWQRRVAEERAKLQVVLYGLRRALAPEDALRRLRNEDLETLKDVERRLDAVRPENMEAGRQRIDREAQRRGDEGPLRAFYHSMVEFALSGQADVLNDMAARGVGPAPDRPVLASREAVTSAVDDALRAAHVPAGFMSLSSAELGQEESERRFQRLKHVALVVTKTDLHPVNHPPELFPRQRLPATWQHLRFVGEYLKVLGGGVEYYNASATGYCILQDGQYVPGKEASLTPINVIEPLLRMLGLKEE